MNIPSFVDLKKYMSLEERTALILLLNAALGQSMAQVRKTDGVVHEGYLNIRLPQDVQAGFDQLINRLK